MLSDMVARNMIICMQYDDILDGSNCDVWHLKVQFYLNNDDMLGLLTSSMTAPAEKDEQGRDITVTEQYKENLNAY